MPPELVKAHHKLDAAVDAAYSKKKFSGDRDRVAFLFELYQQLTKPVGEKIFCPYMSAISMYTTFDRLRPPSKQSIAPSGA
jgi:hypothetical protein